MHALAAPLSTTQSTGEDSWHDVDTDAKARAVAQRNQR